MRSFPKTFRDIYIVFGFYTLINFQTQNQI